jgi:acyl-CoA dehydrogenase
LHQKVCTALGEKLPFYHLDKVALKGIELGVLSDSEAKLLSQTEVGRQAIIAVDDFDSKELCAGS